MPQRFRVVGAMVFVLMAVTFDLGAQTTDAAAQPAAHARLIPDAARFCTECGANMRLDRPRGVRIVDASERVLFMSAGDAKTFVWATPQADALNDLDASHVKTLDIRKAPAAEKLYGKQYANGVVTVALSDEGAEAWRKAVAVRSLQR